ncbi:MAG: hypothetical protein EAZ92_06590 [Candidatus Kapaibacterium sp.]|nr:MAG: hypothetical protein EAZ92_06590 [Candidatus Kapabacteria bacterium]
MLAIQQFACRKIAIDYIRNARVQVNGVLSQDPNVRVNYKHDAITIDAMGLQRNRTSTYILVNKPAKLTASREAQTFTLHSMIHDTEAWFFPLGRLLKSASGLTLLTNDPMHRDPASTAFDGIEKEFHIKVHRAPKKTELTAMTKALKELNKTNDDVAKVEVSQKNARHCWISFVAKKLTLQEICAILKNAKLEPLSMHRYRIGNLTSDALTAGSWKQLNNQEVALLFGKDPSGEPFFFK